MPVSPPSSKIPRVVFELVFNTSVAPISVIDSSTALGRAKIAVLNCGVRDEKGCNMCGYMVVLRDSRRKAPRATCTFSLVYSQSTLWVVLNTGHCDRGLFLVTSAFPLVGDAAPLLRQRKHLKLNVIPAPTCHTAFYYHILGPAHFVLMKL